MCSTSHTDCQITGTENPHLPRKKTNCNTQSYANANAAARFTLLPSARECISLLRLPGYLARCFASVEATAGREKNKP